ncbi:uncharacterized protein BCR38DRAFT_528586 [Pseudomassariella vexata]|uniref:Uncharacterized protein n=1 Tax=Pseudomassariella vexata TaxID=1141098 RepID=A0A1Y2DB43_9PEZI|nr:uncharacterized protein BCR38DRAFT_528586 [Pseudomassariella vexata]ORY56417.1 hypothetical protein BCR38DRAFT_528586 [Pseudomassariella vexata]
MDSPCRIKRKPLPNDTSRNSSMNTSTPLPYDSDHSSQTLISENLSMLTHDGVTTPALMPVYMNEFQGCEKQHPDRPTSKFKIRGGGWGLEIAGLLTTILSFIALVILVRKVDGQLLSSWKFFLPVNTVVSVLSISIKTPLAFVVGACIGQNKWSWFSKRPGPLSGFVAFDEASRGPLGCLTLLWWLKSCHWASLGAWVTLTLLAVDPFLQAVIMYEGQLDSVSVSAAETGISRASKLDFGDWYYEIMKRVEYRGIFGVMGICEMYPDAGVSATTLMGFVNSSTASPTQPPLFTCRTGNCTFPLYSSVGMCSRCADVSEHVVKESRFGLPDENPFTRAHGSDAVQSMNYTNYVLPYNSGRRLLLQRNNGFSNLSRYSGSRIPRVDVTSVYYPQQTYSFQDSSTLLASFGIVSVDQSYWNNLTPWEDTNIYATECVLEFCAQVFQATVQDGILQEIAIPSATFNRVPNSFQPTAWETKEIMKGIETDFGNSLGMYDQKSYGVLPGVVLSRSDLQLRMNGDAKLPMGDNTVQTVFNITQKSIHTISYFLAQNTTLDSIVYSLSDSTDFLTTFQTAARLLSNRFRELDDNKNNRSSTSSNLVTGTAEQWVTYIRVCWVFFIGPTLVLLAGFVFVLGALYDSHSQRLEKMNSDALAMLMHGVDGETRARLREEKREGRRADRIWVRLEDEKSGLSLRSQE